MAVDTVNRVVEVGKLKPKEGVEPRSTDSFILEGGEGWQLTSFIRLIQDFGLDIDVRDGHCDSYYGY